MVQRLLEHAPHPLAHDCPTKLELAINIGARRLVAVFVVIRRNNMMAFGDDERGLGERQRGARACSRDGEGLYHRGARDESAGIIPQEIDRAPAEPEIDSEKKKQRLLGF